MKLSIRQEWQEGNILMVGMMVSLIIGLGLASYLRLVSSANMATYRSLAWNSALPVAEAGAEEALSHLNHFAVDGWLYDLESPLEQALASIHARHTNSWESDGWTLQEEWLVKERDLGDAYYVAKISKTMPPVILSEGYVKTPLASEYMEPRVIRVETKLDKLFSKAMVTKNEIDLKGNQIRTDSFDSSDPNFSTDGRYDAAKAKDNGDVATNSSIIDSLNVGGAKIFGRVATGPGGKVRLGSGGSVGSTPWHTGGNSGIEPGYSSDDMNVYFPDVKQPFSGGYTVPSGGTVDGEEYDYVLGDGNYMLSTLKLEMEQDMLVTGQAVLLVENNVRITDYGYIELAEGASLRLFVKGATAHLGGNGVANPTGSALRFFYLGLPSNSQVNIMGNASFTGMIYAPQANLTLGGGGSDTYDFVGATVADSVKVNGHYQFHYDEHLGGFGPDRGFIVTSWNEITRSQTDSQDTF